MAGQVLHALLSSGEYDEIEDVVMADGEFIEMDENRKAVRQVILGITPFNLIIAERILTDYKKHPEVYFLADANPFLLDLEVSSVWPICLLRMNFTRTRFNLAIVFYDRTRYYLLTNTQYNKDLEETWTRWLERVLYIREDPYGYIRAQYDRYDFPYPDYYKKLTADRDTNSNETFCKDTELERNVEDEKTAEMDHCSINGPRRMSRIQRIRKRLHKNWFGSK